MHKPEPTPYFPIPVSVTDLGKFRNPPVQLKAEFILIDVCEECGLPRFAHSNKEIGPYVYTICPHPLPPMEVLEVPKNYDAAREREVLNLLFEVIADLYAALYSEEVEAEMEALEDS